jgi:hypothetical protein
MCSSQIFQNSYIESDQLVLAGLGSILSTKTNRYEKFSEKDHNILNLPFLSGKSEKLSI